MLKLKFLRPKAGSPPAAAPEDDFSSLLTAFTSGRLAYDALLSRLKECAAQQSNSHDAAQKAIKTAVESGKLPNDLGQILTHQLIGQNRPETDENAGAKRQTPAHSAEFDDDFDEPTIPLTTANATFAPTSAPSGERPNESPYLPPLPFLLDPPTTAGDSMRDKIDDVVLSSVVDGFKGFRRAHDGSAASTPAAPTQNPGKLDHFLTDYRSARFRSDARRAADGKSRQTASLDKLGESERAGVGSILRGRFILDEEIGRGGMGVVYSAVDRRRLEAGHDKPYVALKLLNDTVRANPDALRQLEAEARKAQTLAHPNVATIYDFDRDKAEVFLVMELLRGTPLDRRLALSIGRGLPSAQCARILRGTCAALQYAHNNDIVHSDLKPGNIFVLEDGAVKLIDFGLAAAAVSAQGDDGSLTDGAFTPAYASPEMFYKAPRDPRDDIFALGCIAYQLLAGNHPFAMQASNEAAKDGLRPKPLDDLDPKAWNALLGALAFEREKRTPTVTSFIKELFETDDA